MFLSVARWPASTLASCLHHSCHQPFAFHSATASGSVMGSRIRRKAGPSLGSVMSPVVQDHTSTQQYKTRWRHAARVQGVSVPDGSRAMCEGVRWGDGTWFSVTFRASALSRFFFRLAAAATARALISYEIPRSVQRASHIYCDSWCVLHARPLLASFLSADFSHMQVSPNPQNPLKMGRSDLGEKVP